MGTAIDRFKELKRAADALKQAFKAFEAYCSNPSQYDKRGFAFCEDSRFSAFSTKVSLDTWIGTYGSSSCSPFLHIDEKIAAKFFAQALNANRDQILQTMERLIREEAAKQYDAASKELADMQAALDSAKQEAA